MSHDVSRLGKDEDGYREYERKMQLFEDGPTTTNFEQLVAKGIELPPSDSIPEPEIREKLWQVIHGLSELRVYISDSDHLTDRELYTKLWSDVLREDTPAIDEIGFSSHVHLLHCGADDADTELYLKHYADDRFRQGWLEADPDCVMPAHADAPYDRDVLLPHGDIADQPEALKWLRANHNPSPFATNRFPTAADALTFVERLYAAGAQDVLIDNIMLLPHNQWAPYADTLHVELPDDPARRRELFELIEHEGRPDEWDKSDEPLISLRYDAPAGARSAGSHLHTTEWES